MMRNGASSSIRTPMRSKSFSPYRSLRKHATEKYGKAVTGFSLDTSADLETNYRTMRNLENEYIKSLQQQIYLLELENNYIRHQAAEVMDKQPLMVCEASNSLKKLKEMQERTDGLKLEIHRKEAHISILQQKLNRCEGSLRETLLYRDKEKDELTRQCMTLRGERELALREVYQKDEQIKELQYQLCNQKSNITAMEIQLDILRAKDKIRHLEQKLSDAFLRSENDRYIKDKQTDKNDVLLKENLHLSNELEKLRKLAEESQSLFERSQFKQTEDIAELNRLKQRENELMHMNAMLRQDVLLKSRENEKLQQELAYREKTSDSLLSGKQIQPDLTQQFEALKKERQLFIENVKKINEEIAEQKIKIDRLEQEKTKPLNNDSWINKHTNGNDDIQLLLNEESLSPVNINKANTSPTSRKPVDEAIIKAIQRPRK
ncbi:unnamed protein product [Schistosoma intercalatum]|nr:unnamed protein product [Schistosoma intercalatum]